MALFITPLLMRTGILINVPRTVLLKQQSIFKWELFAVLGFVIILPMHVGTLQK